MHKRQKKKDLIEKDLTEKEKIMKRIKILSLPGSGCDFFTSVLVNNFFVEVVELREVIEDEEVVEIGEIAQEDIEIVLTKDILSWLNDLYTGGDIRDFLYRPYKDGKDLIKYRKEFIDNIYDKDIINYENLITDDILNKLESKYLLQRRHVEKIKNKEEKEKIGISMKHIYGHPDFSPLHEVKLGYLNYVHFFNHVNFTEDYRVNYYLSSIKETVYINKENISSTVEYDKYCVVTKETKFNEKTTYVKDLQTYMSTLFPNIDYSLICMLGDSMKGNIYPCLAKSRWKDDKGKRVLLRLNTQRHFFSIREVVDIPFREKNDKLIWRGDLRTGRRREIFSLLNISTENIDIKGEFLTVRDMVKSKFLLSIEGNDVATNLKWALYSASCVLMPTPRATSWIMEDQLVPYIHYIPLKDDLQDLEEKYHWCLKNLDICEKIGINGKKYIQQFLTEEREKRIILRVLTSFMEKVVVI
jgi:hypothetical protein